MNTAAAAPPVLHDVTVLVPTIGRPDLERCLQSVARGSAWPASIMIVDQSTDAQVVMGCIEQMQRLGVATEHVRSEPVGIGGAMNRGLRRVTTPFVAVTHDDCEVSPDWLARLTARLRQRPDAIVTGQLRPARRRSREGGTATVVTSEVPAEFDRRGFMKDFLVVANMGMAIRVYQRAGPFSEVPLLRVAAEDNEWAYHVLGAGIPIIYDPEIRVLHHHWQKLAELADTYRRYALGQGALYGLYLAKGEPRMFVRTAVDMMRAPWWVLRGLLTGNRSLRAVGVAYLRYLPAGVLAGLRYRADG